MLQEVAVKGKVQSIDLVKQIQTMSLPDSTHVYLKQYEYRWAVESKLTIPLQDKLQSASQR